MYANTIVFLCFSFATFKDCTSSNIFSYLDSKLTPPNYISDGRRKDVENIYIRSLPPDAPRDDPVCALTAGRKKALCELIFQLAHYRNIGIYLGKVAHHFARLPCEEKLLSFRMQTDFTGKSVKQKMYPCYGRHEPVRTSFIEDNYYDSFYVSGGPDLNSVTVYVHEYNTISDWYTVYDYIHNVHVSELRDMFITVEQVVVELKLNKYFITTSNQSELESIFVREQNHIKTDPICDLEYEKKISLCIFVFQSPIYAEHLGITLNKAGVYLFDMRCGKKPVTIHVPRSFIKSHQVEQEMYPCYARKRILTGEILTDSYLRQFFVSRGPRNNSVFVYVRVNVVGQGEDYRILQLWENVNTRDLKPTEITDEELAEESPTTYLNVLELIAGTEKRAERAGLLPGSESVFGKKVTAAQFEAEERRQTSSQASTDEADRAFGKVMESIKKQKKKTEFKKTKRTSEKVTVKAEKSKKSEEVEPERREGVNEKLLEKILNVMAADKTRTESESIKKSGLVGVIGPPELVKDFPKDEKVLESSTDYARIGPQVMERLKAKRGTELASKTNSGASTSSQRLRRKLEQRKLMMEKGKPTVAEGKFDEDVDKLIQQMEKSLVIEGTKSTLSEKEKIPKRSTEESQGSDEQYYSMEEEKDEDKEKKTKKQRKKPKESGKK